MKKSLLGSIEKLTDDTIGVAGGVGCQPGAVTRAANQVAQGSACSPNYAYLESHSGMDQNCMPFRDSYEGYCYPDQATEPPNCVPEPAYG
jgi:hypothetical protein